MQLEDLTKELTPEECKATVYKLLERVGIATTSWLPGSPTRTIIAVFAVLFAYVSYLVAGIASMAFLATARGPWLTLKARYDYDTERRGATRATGAVTIRNTSGAPYTLGADDLILSAPELDLEFRNLSPVTIAANGDTLVTVASTQEGSAASAPAGSITKVITALPGVSVLQPSALIGQDEERDISLRARAKASTATLSPHGPKLAYQHAATSCTRADGSPIEIAKLKLVADGGGGIDAYVANASGPIATSDLATVNEAMQRVAPLAVTLRVATSVALPLTVQYQVWCYLSASLNESQVRAACDAALSERIARVPIGGDGGMLWLNSIRGCLDNTLPEIYRVTVSVPTGDVPVKANEVVTLASVFGTVFLTPPPEGSV
jgi:phage-related baseplate assembly protein